ncbi:MAG: ABC transporter ATP-binding protein [Acidobacteria bacterium]|nr:ABC transporter ATP-binding protein [Acidobacteriota bacterium]
MTHEEDVLGKAYDARLMRRLLVYLRPYRRSVLVALAAILAGAALQLVPPWLTLQVIDTYIPARDLDGLMTIGALYLATLVGEFLLEYVQTTTLQITGQRIMFDVRMEIYAHLQRLDIRFYDRNPVGRLMTRVTTDVDALNELFTSGVVSVFGDVFALTAIMGAMLLLDWQLALVAFAVIPFIATVTQWFRVHVRDTYRDVRTWIARINAFLQENITGMSTVQLFRREKRNFSQFDEVNTEHMAANVRAIFYYAVFHPAIEILTALATALILWFGGGRVVDDTLTLGTLVAFIQYAQRLFRPIQDLSEKFNVLQAAMASSERVFQLLDTRVDIRTPVVASAAALANAAEDATVVRPPADVHIAFENVWFAYNDTDWVLRDVSFTVRPGERIGVVGATGAGKTTIINLLLRFYDVTKGRITFNGVDIRDLALAQVRGLFGLVLQDVHLFSGSIAANVRLGDDAISDADVRATLQAVNAEAFVDALGGIDAAVAERGATLSVGQKQLLSFARALAFDPPVLVLDEATSSIDTDTELLIREALTVLMRGRTTIAIAHRLSTIQDMDRVLVFHKGELRESGRHQELLAERGIYRRLYDLQYTRG